MINGIFYSNRYSFLLQERGSEQGMIVLENTSKNAQDHTAKFPLISPDYMLIQLYDEGDYYEQQKNCIKLYIAPPINSKTIKISEDYYGLSNQYFLYSDDNYVIDIEVYTTLPTTVKLNSKTGYTYDTQVIENEDDNEDRSFAIQSRNGRYLLYVAFISTTEITTRLVSIDKDQGARSSDLPDTGDSKSPNDNIKKSENVDEEDEKEKENEKENDPENTDTEVSFSIK